MSYTGKMIPGDTINEVRRRHQRILFVFIFHLFKFSYLILIFSLFSFFTFFFPFFYFLIYIYLLILSFFIFIFNQIRSGPQKSTFFHGRLNRLFCIRNMKHTQNMLQRRRSEWVRAERMKVIRQEAIRQLDRQS